MGPRPSTFMVGNVAEEEGLSILDKSFFDIPRESIRIKKSYDENE